MQPPAAGSPAGPSVSEPSADDIVIRSEPFQGTPEEIERQWYEQVYCGRGDSMPQLTWRAIAMGSILGGILSLTNLYIGLKSGWGFGVAITACILSFTIWTALHRIRLVRTPMSILENNCMQSTASAAGYSTGTTLVSAFAAYLMLNNQTMPLPEMLAWVFLLAVLGVTMAIPMKRQMVNIEQLRFPTGLATAETLRALYSKGRDGVRASRGLGVAGVVAALSTFLTDGLRLVSSALEPYQIGAWVEKLNHALFGKAWMARTVMFTWDPIFIAAGALSGMRVCLSMLVSGTLCWVVFVPVLQGQGIITGTGYREVVAWTLWGGVSCMVTSGLLSFFMQWRTAMRAFRGLGQMFAIGQPRASVDVMDRLEAPMSWFLIGQVAALAGMAWLAHHSFGMPLWQTTLAVVMSFALALVACRVTGETDTTPIGAMGKVTQLTFGVLNPGNVNVNLMAANITSGAAISSADLLTDIKSGYLLGANPRKQFLAQFAGIFSGTLVTVISFRLLVPTAEALGGDQFPAPAGQTWRAVAIALSQGLSALEPVKVWSIVVGGTVGIVLPLLPLLFPKQQRFMPSAAGVGLAWTFHWYYGLLFFLGALIAWIYERRSPKDAAVMTFPVASGVIAGGSLMGVLLIFWESGPAILRQLLGK